MQCLSNHDHCPGAKTMRIVGSKWTITLLHHIRQGKNRFGQLQRSMKGISTKTLTFRLQELEDEGILVRKVFPGLPLHVEYFLTDKGIALGKVIASMDEWGSISGKKESAGEL